MGAFSKHVIELYDVLYSRKRAALELSVLSNRDRLILDFFERVVARVHEHNPQKPVRCCCVDPVCAGCHVECWSQPDSRWPQIRFSEGKTR